MHRTTNYFQKAQISLIFNGYFLFDTLLSHVEMWKFSSSAMHLCVNQPNPQLADSELAKVLFRENHTLSYMVHCVSPLKATFIKDATFNRCAKSRIIIIPDDFTSQLR